MGEPVARGLRAALEACVGALQWASGSSDFSENGMARRGWVEVGRPALEEGMKALSAAPKNQPLGNVEWVDPVTLHANHYNPNRVFGTEMDLLKTSILEDGWTQPIVARVDGEIVDGFHRWTLGLRDAEIRAFSNGLVPVVRVAPRAEADQMLATIRHNRARGRHGILHMAEIVRALLAQGLTPKDLEERLGMEREEVERLADMRPAPEKLGRESFGKGWVPAESSEQRAADAESAKAKLPRQGE
jgi:ParB-like chromosome segregation protein Spo0J